MDGGKKQEGLLFSADIGKIKKQGGNITSIKSYRFIFLLLSCNYLKI